MKIIHSNYYVITGGPGAGKTTLIKELENRGYSFVPEGAREIIGRQIETGGDALPWGDTVRYTQLMLEWSISDFTRYGASDELRFFDRGIPDVLAYNRLTGNSLLGGLAEAVELYRYNPLVFVLPPWEDIYCTDSERKQNFQEAVATFGMLKTVYRDCGYHLIEVPEGSPENRAAFVLENAGR